MTVAGALVVGVDWLVGVVARVVGVVARVVGVVGRWVLPAPVLPVPVLPVPLVPVALVPFVPGGHVVVVVPGFAVVDVVDEPGVADPQGSATS